MSKIKNIIFDLGGVIINLEINRTIQEFNKISKIPFESIYTRLQQTNIFDLFDKGQISENDFFDNLTQLVDSNASRKDVLFAWNAMLLDFPLHRLQLLNRLKNDYRIFLLSNTNETHVTAFELELYQKHGYENLESFFEKVHYSCRMGMRKPDTEIFESLINEHQLNPEETFFIDDSPQHIEGARKTGISALLLDKNKEVADLLKEQGIL